MLLCVRELFSKDDRLDGVEALASSAKYSKCAFSNLFCWMVRGSLLVLSTCDQALSSSQYQETLAKDSFDAS